MIKITLPALLRNGYSAVSFYQSHGITIASCNGFDADATLPENAAIAHQGKKTKLYVNNQLIGCFDTSEYKIRFDSTKAVAVPKKPKPADIVDTAKVEKAARPQKTTIVNVVSSSPAPSEKPQIMPQINTPAPVAKTDAPPREKKVRKISVPPQVVRRKRDIDFSKEKWIEIAMQYGTDIEAIGKYAKCCRATVYARLKEYVPVELWQKPIKSKDNPISLNCDFWRAIHKKHNGNFETIAIELQCKASTARIYFYESGAAAVNKAEKKAKKVPKPRRVYTPKATRQKRLPTQLKDKALWERLAQEHSTVKDMAAAIGKGIDTCYAYLNKYVPADKWKKQKPGKETDKAFWAALCEKHGEDWQAIAKESGFTLNTARIYIRKSGVAADIRAKKEAERQQLIKEQEAKRLDLIDQREIPIRRLEAATSRIVDMMNNGATVTAIRKAFNTHYDTVSNFLKRPDIASQIHYVTPKGAASYEIRQLHPKEKILAATSQTKTISKLSAMLSIDKRTIKQLMVAYEIPFKK